MSSNNYDAANDDAAISSPEPSNSRTSRGAKQATAEAPKGTKAAGKSDTGAEQDNELMGKALVLRRVSAEQFANLLPRDTPAAFARL